MTSVLKSVENTETLDRWRERVGLEEANKISKRATVRGTALHSMCENLVLNRDLELSKQMPTTINLFRQMQKVLEADVDNIRSSEGALYSDYLKVAGTVDLVADYKGETAIIDFKTSGRFKKREWVESYFLQTALYSFMLWERTKIVCRKLVVVIAIEEELDAQVFVEPASKYVERARDICKSYHKNACT